VPLIRLPKTSQEAAECSHLPPMSEMMPLSPTLSQLPKLPITEIFPCLDAALNLKQFPEIASRFPDKNCDANKEPKQNNEASEVKNALEKFTKSGKVNTDCAGCAVVVAPPGAGKSTLLPLHLLSQIKTGLIILVEPRRLVARACARRMAALLGEKVGETVGYRMRMDEASSSRTRILVVTEGVFNHMLLDDPELNHIQAVLFDEFHERHLDADFGLALALDVKAALRPDLAVIVMSATIDGARIAKLMGDAPVITSQGRSFDVEIRYCPKAANKRLEEVMADHIQATLLQEQGNILAFLPGQGEIERTIHLLKGRIGADILLAPLYGTLDRQAQDTAIALPPEGKRKVVLATSIAETSLTIEGVRIVIDSGFARIPVYEPAHAMTRLETVRASQASVAQRAGRAGRLEAGIAIRLWHEGQTSALIPFDRPEILSADLASLRLDCAAFGVNDPAQLAFLDPPPLPAWVEAQRLLIQLGALDEAGRLSVMGQRMRRLALPVRYAYMVAHSPSKTRQKAAEIAVLLSERGLGYGLVAIEERYRHFKADLHPRAKQAKQLARRLAKLAGEESCEPITLQHKMEEQEEGEEDDMSLEPFPKNVKRFSDQNCDENKKPEWLALPAKVKNTLAVLLMHAWPDRIAKARGRQGIFLMSNGRAARIDEDNPLSLSPYLVIADLAGKAENLRILAAIETDEATIRTHLATKIVSQHIIDFDDKSNSIRARLREQLGQLLLGESPLPALTGEAANQAWTDLVRRHGTAILPWSKAAQTLRQRLDWLHKTCPASWPDVSESALTKQPERWLQDFLPGLSQLNATTLQREGDFVHAALSGLLPYELQYRLEHLAPTYFTTPTGSRIPINYQADAPCISVRVQELFGLDQHPSIADGQLKLVVELLSPAHRPIQITQDLPGFWRGSWGQIRSQMRGRYPKHAWPENPLAEPPTHRAKARK